MTDQAAPGLESEQLPFIYADPLGDAISRAHKALQAQQHVTGYWCYELEADCTIPAEYIMMMHYMDEIDEALEQKIAVHLRDRQANHGGWSLYHGGSFDLSGSVKVYYALKLAGDDPGAPHMERARRAILDHGGAAKSNVFTRIALALFEQLPWRGVPFVPVENILLPRWFPFHIDKVSYWSRTVMVPLSILCSLKPAAANPKKIGIEELFTTPAWQERDYFPVRSWLNRVFILGDAMGRALEPLIPGFIRRMAIKKAENWFIERLNGTDGLGAIFPAMVNAHEALALLGYPEGHPYRLQTKAALEKLLVVKNDSAYCQPCVSPVWDTALAAFADIEAAGGKADNATLKGLDWLAERQLVDEPADWRNYRPGVRGGGWPFQFGNDHYPDLDDTPVVGWAMLRADRFRYAEQIELACEWTASMQSRNGGFASFDADNTYDYLNQIPFADHGALLDPPTCDVTARCVAMLSLYDADRYRETIDRAIEFLKSEQEANGSWFGRWGTNYIYGTWSVLTAMEVAGIDPSEDWIVRAVEWLKTTQNSDGGWGESNDTYGHPENAGHSNTGSTSFQTAWALLALLATGQHDCETVHGGMQYLMETQNSDGQWFEEDYTAPGFPRVFYLKYHGYDKYFPLWAMARYRNLNNKQA